MPELNHSLTGTLNAPEKRFASVQGEKTSELGGNTSTGVLKLIALFFMIIDHLGVVVFPDIPDMRIYGRIAFPIYCWCLIVGFHYTRSVPKYLGRILLTGLISQPLYAYVMNHMGTTGILWQDLLLTKPNIFLTLFLGLAALWGIREREDKTIRMLSVIATLILELVTYLTTSGEAARWNLMGTILVGAVLLMAVPSLRKYSAKILMPLTALALATALGVDYGWRGVLLIMLMYAARKNRSSLAAVMIAFFLYWGAFYGLTTVRFGRTLDYSWMPQWLYQPISAFLRLETYALFSLPFILIPFRHTLKMPVWLSYAIYPAHLLLVLAVKLLMGVS